MEFNQEQIRGGIDLHIHTLYSDGTDSPSDIMRLAKERGLKVISFTDHATTSAYSQIEMKGDIAIVPGVEITANYNGQKLHILGYGDGVFNESFQHWLKEIRNRWNERFFDMLSAYNYVHACSIGREELRAISKETINIDNLCEIIVRKKEPYNNIELVKQKYFSKKSEESLYISPCVDNYIPNVMELLHVMTQEKIMPVLAHTTLQEIEDLSIDIFKLKDEGLYGWEAFHPKYNYDEANDIISFCKKNGLYIFGGSDYHGRNKKNELGQGLNNINVKIPFWVYSTSVLRKNNIIRSINRQLEISNLSLEEKIYLLLKPNYDYYLFNDDNYPTEMYTRIIKSRISCLEDLLLVIRTIFDNSAIPILINVNQEGGRLNTIDWDWIHKFPGNNSLGRIDNLELIEKIAELMGMQLRALGITWNLAPVVDLNITSKNPAIAGRSFGNNAYDVAKKVRAFITGLQKSGVAATAKHFPGIGLSVEDPHYNCPVIEQLSIADLKPFVFAINAGVSSIMVTNTIVKCMDETKPACMSKVVITKLLREQLGYSGIIVTDNISMDSMTNLPIGKIALECFMAGADIIMYEPDFSRGKEESNFNNKTKIKNLYNKWNQIYNEIYNAVREGVISEERLDESVIRIINFYNNYGIRDASEFGIEKYNKLCIEVEYWLQECAKETVRFLYKREGYKLDISKTQTIVIQLWKNEKLRADSTYNINFNYKKLLEDVGVTADICIGNNINAHVNHLSKYETIIYVSYNMHIFREDRIFFEKVSSNKNVIVLGIGDDEEIKYMKKDRIVAYLSVGSFTYYQMKRALEMLLKY